MTLVQDWFRVREEPAGVWIIEEPLHSEQVKSYLVLGSARAALIDTGMGVGDIRALVESLTSLPVIVLQSHAHNDHIGGSSQFDEVLVHQSEADDLADGQTAERLANWFAPHEMSGLLPPGFEPRGYRIPGKTATGYLAGGDRVDLGERSLEVLHLPGHSRGGLCFLDRTNRCLFSTDVVYLRDLYLMNPDSSVSDYVASLERLVAYMDSVDRLYPSHGPSPISPAVISDMAAGMREVADGREPDEVDEDPILDGGVGAVPTREQIRIHDFGTFRILVSSQAQL